MPRIELSVSASSKPAPTQLRRSNARAKRRSARDLAVLNGRRVSAAFGLARERAYLF